MGLKGRVKNVYWRFIKFINDDITESGLNGTSAEFRTETIPEIKRVHNLLNEKEVMQDLITELKDDDVFFDI